MLDQGFNQKHKSNTQDYMYTCRIAPPGGYKDDMHSSLQFIEENWEWQKKPLK